MSQVCRLQGSEKVDEAPGRDGNPAPDPSGPAVQEGMSLGIDVRRPAK